MKIAYAVPHELTGAVRQRVVGIAQSLCLIDGVSVTLLGPQGSFETDDPTGISYVETESRRTLGDSGIAKAKWRFVLGRDTASHLDAHVQPDLLIVYGGGALYMSRLQAWAKSAGIPIAADIVEWYDSSHQPLGKFGPYALDNRLMMTRVAARCDGIIVISSYLRRHFEATSSASVVTIPPTMDVEAMPWGPANADKQRLVYCGSPGRKDRLDLVVRALNEFDPSGERFELLIAGPDEVTVRQLCGIALPSGVRALGRVTHGECLELVQSADWTPLIRNDRRFAQAGFPTKIAESMALGTPPLVNLTSDLRHFLRDGENSVIVNSDSVAAVCEALERAQDMTMSERAALSRSARRAAEQAFDYRHYVQPLSLWMANLTSGLIGDDGR